MIESADEHFVEMLGRPVAFRAKKSAARQSKRPAAQQEVPDPAGGARAAPTAREQLPGRLRAVLLRCRQPVALVRRPVSMILVTLLRQDCGDGDPAARTSPRLPSTSPSSSQCPIGARRRRARSAPVVVNVLPPHARLQLRTSPSQGRRSPSQGRPGPMDWAGPCSSEKRAERAPRLSRGFAAPQRPAGAGFGLEGLRAERARARARKAVPALTSRRGRSLSPSRWQALKAPGLCAAATTTTLSHPLSHSLPGRAAGVSLRLPADPAAAAKFAGCSAACTRRGPGSGVRFGCGVGAGRASGCGRCVCVRLSAI